MVIEGYIFDKITISEKVIQIVMRRKHKEKYIYVCFIAFGRLIDKIAELDLEQKDKIRIEYYIKSKKWNERYSTDAIIENIELKERRTNQITVDFETGEILD